MKEKEYFDVDVSELTFKSFSELKPELVRGGIGILILPSSSSHDAFYSGTLELLDHMKENSSGDVIDIFASDEDYKELAQHSADYWIGTFLIGGVFVPLFVNLLSSYIFEKLKAGADDKISVNVIVERKDGKSSSVNFRGDAKDFQKVIDSVRALADD
jgi:hypothetical protein